ncbi:MAG: putative baseplate assembly protein [Cellvibrio sp.]
MNNAPVALKSTRLACKSERRRDQVRNKDNWNGLDYVEVSECQRVLTVYFLGKAPSELLAENIRIEGGRRITDIQVTHIDILREEAADIDDYVQVFLDKYGDFSTYRLSVIEIAEDTKRPIYSKDSGVKSYLPMRGFDPRYSSVEFTFKASCPSDLDCKTPSHCAPALLPGPEINYLAKDYSSFRQLILDRMALTMPEWRERHIPDLGITLVELLAYVGDHLSYYQDAVATEAYLDTARRRVSVRRHVRLVDYHLHEGCNARAWVVFELLTDITLAPKDFYLITQLADAGYTTEIRVDDLPKSEPKPWLVYEPLVANPTQELKFYKSRNAIQIYTWGDARCCLAAGSISATLLDPGVATGVPPEEPNSCEVGPGDRPKHRRENTENPQQPASATHQSPTHQSPAQQSPTQQGDASQGTVPQDPVPQDLIPQDSDYKLQLEACDILIFEEVKGPNTGHPGDANPQHRHAVRLVKAQKSQDPLTGQLIWEVEWAVQDALPFALCVSSINREDCSLIEDVSLVRGNVLLVDHGETIPDEPLGSVPETLVTPPCGDGCLPHETQRRPGKYRPVLSQTNLTFSQPLPPCKVKHKGCRKTEYTPASSMLHQNVRTALPAISLTETNRLTSEWLPQLDLLGSTADEPHFVVEVEDDRSAHLRFGANGCGRSPAGGATFSSRYRVGNGSLGNVGAESITHIVFSEGVGAPEAFLRVRNPMPAAGGTNPEPVAEAKLFAPHAFKKTLERAIIAKDYEDIVVRDFGDKVQRAAAKLQWTGSWYQVLIAIDPLGTAEFDEDLLHDIKHHLNRYRRIGHDLVIAQANYVPIEVGLCIQVLPHYLRGHVKAALQDAFSNRQLPGGRKGFFHPDNLSFGDDIYLSKLVATAQAIPGVENAVVTLLKRQFVSAETELEDGLLPIGPFEIAQLDQDPNFPEHGNLKLDIRGGR